MLEIGPGPGGLTKALLDAGVGHLVAVERDPRFASHLRELEALSAGRLRVVEGDALELDPCQLAEGGRLRIVANLPYNVATPMLFGWFDRLACIELMVLMFQKEVALRLAAAPGTADYGRLAVMAQLLCRVERVFDLPPAAFRPPPKVSSSVVRLTPLPERPDDALRATLADLTRAAFGQRRKMLRSSLRGFAKEPLGLLEAAGIEPTRRAEELTVAQFRQLAALHLQSARP